MLNDPYPPIDMTMVNPGVRKLVALLREKGFNTQDCGDGSTHDHECDQPFPYVHILVANPFAMVNEAFRLKNYLAGWGVTVEPLDPELSVPTIEAICNPADPEGATISLYNVLDTMLPDSVVAK